MKQKYQKPSIAIIELESSNTLLVESRQLPENYEQVRFTEEDCDPA